jgi:hypothetical protein
MSDERSRSYRVLELEPGVSLKEVKEAYRALAKVWHPDRFPNDEALQRKAQEKLKEINTAFQTLENLLTSTGPSAQYSKPRQEPADRGQNDRGGSKQRPPPPLSEKEWEVVEQSPLSAIVVFGTITFAWFCAAIYELGLGHDWWD